jgi:hypothetical protein
VNLHLLTFECLNQFSSWRLRSSHRLTS